MGFSPKFEIEILRKGLLLQQGVENATALLTGCSPGFYSQMSPALFVGSHPQLVTLASICPST